MATLRLFFSRDTADDADTIDPTNYVITSGVYTLAVDSVVRRSGRVVELTITAEMSARTYTVEPTINDANGHPINAAKDTATFTGTAGVAPQVTAAASQNATTVRVTFNEAMERTSMETAGNYAVAGDTSIAVSSAAWVDSTHVDLTLTGEMRTGVGNYTVTASGVTDAAGNAIDAAHDDAAFDGVGVAPQLSSATATNSATVRAVFNETMGDGSGDSALTRAANYAFTSPVGFVISASSVAKVNGTTVDITLSGEMITGADNYTLTVSNVVDAAGNVIDAAHDDDLFSGVGRAPRVSSVTWEDEDELHVVFDEDMDEALAEDTSHYSVTGPTSPAVSTATLEGDKRTVHLVLAANMEPNGRYNVEVTNHVKGTCNTAVDPAYNSAYVHVWVFKTASFATAYPNGGGSNCHPMAYHSGDSKMVLLTCAGVTWTNNGSDWTNTGAAAPTFLSSVESGICVCRGPSNTVIVFGGWDGHGPAHDHNDTWYWDGVLWTDAAPAHKPSTRADVMMAYDTARGVTVLFGGTHYNGGPVDYMQDTWEWDGTDWEQVSTATSPPGRAGGDMAYDAANGVMVLYGGNGASGSLYDTWTYDGSNWTNKNPAAHPTARYGFEMDYDPLGERVILFGGQYNVTKYNELWSWNNTNWTRVDSKAGTLPSARVYPCVRNFPADGNNKMLVESGFVLAACNDAFKL